VTPEARSPSCRGCRIALQDVHDPGGPQEYCKECAEQPERWFSTRLARGIEQSPLSLRKISDEMGRAGYHIGHATLSDWRKGRYLPRASSAAHLRALERILHLPDGELALGMALDAGMGQRVRDEAAAKLRRRIARIQGTSPEEERLITTEIRDYSRVGKDRRQVDRVIGQRVVAQRDQVDRYLVLYTDEGGSQTSVDAVSECRRGLVLPPLDGVHAVELVLDKPLAKGEIYDFTFRISYGGGDKEDLMHRRWLPAGLEKLELRVEFPWDMRPRRLSTSTWLHTDAPPEDVAELWLSHRDTAKLRLTDPAVGTHGIRWNWN